MRTVQFSFRRYQPKAMSGALPWRAAWRRLGVLMVVGVRGGLLGVRRGLAGRAAEVRCVCVNVCAFLVGCGWSGPCRTVLWV